MGRMFATFTFINTRIWLFTYHTVDILNRILYEFLLEHYLSILKLPQSINQHTEYMRIIRFIHGQIQEASGPTQLTLINPGSFCLTVFWQEATLTDTLIFGYITILVIPDMTFSTKGERIIHLAEIG